MSISVAEQAREVVHQFIPNRPHHGFSERYGFLTHQIRSQLMGSIATMSEVEEMPLQARLAKVGEKCKKDLNTYHGVRSLDDYLYNRDWQYINENREEHQEDVLKDTLAGIALGHTEGHNEGATSTGKNYEIAKFAEAFYLGGLRVLILAPTKEIAHQNRGSTKNGKPNKGLSQFAPNIDPSDIGLQFDNKKAKASHRVVVSTYQSLNNFAETGELGEFDVILADEAHRSLGEKTSENMKAFSPHAIKIGFTATPRFGINKSIDEIFPYRYNHLPLDVAIERGLTAPIQPLVYATGAKIPNLDPRYPDFTPRELWRLANLKSRNELAVKLAKQFVQDGRKGIISCLPGEELAHAKLIAELVRQEEVIDPKTGQSRLIVAKAVGNYLGNELRTTLDAFDRGEIDVLTYVKVIGEGWDSEIASFLINTCPTTSIVKIIQDVGRIMRRKANGLHSIAVDMADEAIGKKQMTVLHALGQERIDLRKVYGKVNWGTDGDSVTYLRGILDSSLYANLQSVDGLLLSDITLKPRERQRRERLHQYYENLLAKEGLTPDTNLMGVPEEFKLSLQEFEDNFMADYNRQPYFEEILEHLRNLDNTEIGLPKKDYFINIERALAAHTVVRAGLLETVIDEEETWHGKDPADVVTRSRRVMKDAIDEALTELSGIEREIVKTRFSIDNKGYKTLKEVGEIIKLNQERVRQIEARSFSKLRYPYRGDYLGEWNDRPPNLKKTLGEIIRESDAASPVKDLNKFLRWIKTIKNRNSMSTILGVSMQDIETEELLKGPLPKLRNPSELTSQEKATQEAYKKRVDRTVQQYLEYVEVEKPIIDDISFRIYRNLFDHGTRDVAKEDIRIGLTTIKLFNGDISERKIARNNWRVKRIALERFESNFDEVRRAWYEKHIRTQNTSNPSLQFSTNITADIRRQARNYIIDTIRDLVEDVITDVRLGSVER